MTVQYGEPMSFAKIESPSREQSQQAADQVFERIRSMYEALDSEGRRGVIARRRRERGQGAPVTG